MSMSGIPVASEIEAHRQTEAHVPAQPPDVHGSSKHNTTVARATEGSFVGDNTANRAIPHGLGVAPKVVIIIHSVTGRYIGIIAGGIARCFNNTADYAYTPTAPDATNFYVGNAVEFYLNEVEVAENLWVALA